MLLCPHPRILLCVLQGEVARRQNTGATLSINLCRLFSGTHHLPSRRTRVSSKNCWLPSSSSTCPSETLMLRLHSSPLEGKLQLRVGQPPQNTIEIKHFSQKLESAISPFTFPPFTLFTLPTARGLREAEKPRSGRAGQMRRPPTDRGGSHRGHSSVCAAGSKWHECSDVFRSPRAKARDFRAAASYRKLAEAKPETARIRFKNKSKPLALRPYKLYFS